MKYQVGDIAYLIESNRFIREGKILKISGGLYVFGFVEGGGIQVSAHRLFQREEDAQRELDRRKEEKAKEQQGICHNNPYYSR